MRGGGEGRNPPDLPLGAGGGGSEGRGGAESLQVLGGCGEQGGGQWPLTAASLSGRRAPRARQSLETALVLTAGGGGLCTEGPGQAGPGMLPKLCRAPQGPTLSSRPARMPAVSSTEARTSQACQGWRSVTDTAWQPWAGGHDH